MTLEKQRTTSFLLTMNLQTVTGQIMTVSANLLKSGADYPHCLAGISTNLSLTVAIEVSIVTVVQTPFT